MSVISSAKTRAIHLLALAGTIEGVLFPAWMHQIGVRLSPDHHCVVGFTTGIKTWWHGQHSVPLPPASGGPVEGPFSFAVCSPFEVAVTLHRVVSVSPPLFSPPVVLHVTRSPWDAAARVLGWEAGFACDETTAQRVGAAGLPTVRVVHSGQWAEGALTHVAGGGARASLNCGVLARLRSGDVKVYLRDVGHIQEHPDAQGTLAALRADHALCNLGPVVLPV